MAKGARTNARKIPGVGAAGSKPGGGRSGRLPAAAATSTRAPGPNLHVQKQNTAGGPGVTINSQPVN